jgi:hypothetical protein
LRASANTGEDPEKAEERELKEIDIDKVLFDAAMKLITIGSGSKMPKSRR